MLLSRAIIPVVLLLSVQLTCSQLLSAAEVLDQRLTVTDIGIGSVATAANVTQMAFGPDQRLYVARSNKTLLAYDFDPATGALSNEVALSTNFSGSGSEVKPLGLAFHGNDLYATSGVFTGVGRLWRIPGAVTAGQWAPSADALEIVDNIPTQSAGAHSANQLLIIGNSLYLPIGVSSNSGAVDSDNGDSAYSGSVAWIADLSAVEEDNGNWAAIPATVAELRASNYDPVNPLNPADPFSPGHLPLTLASTNPSLASAKLVVYATGLRNPFGISAGNDGRIWVSNNMSRENNHLHYVDSNGLRHASPATDILDDDFSNDRHDQLFALTHHADYGFRLHAWRELHAAAGSGTLFGDGPFFDPSMRQRSHTFDNDFAWNTHADFVWTGPDQGGSWPTSGPAYDPDNPNRGGLPGSLGPHASANGLAAIPVGSLPPDLHGKLAIARWSQTLHEDGGDESITYGDVVTVHPDSGAVQRLVSGLNGANDVLAAADGSLLIGTYNGSIYHLSAAPEAHPRLFLTQSRMEMVRSAMTVSGSHHQRAVASLRARVDASNPDQLDAYGPYGSWGYRRTWMAREAAFLAQLDAVNDPSAAAAYAAKAYATLWAVLNGNNQDRTLVNDSGLSRAMMGIGFALSYDWCYTFWTPSERSWVRAQLMDNLDQWPSFSHANVNDSDKNSNWVAVTRGSELVTLLATYEENDRADRYALVTNDLLTHIDNGHGDHGVSQEGLGYLEYGGQFLATAVLAAQEVSANTLANAYAQHDVHALLRYSHGFHIQNRKFLMQGVSNISNFDEGFASLNLGLVPNDQASRFYYWYDRHIGVANPLRSDAELFDHHRAGTVWSTIFYDPAVVAANPSGTDPAMLIDDHGFHFFRQRWQDEQDIQISFHADLRALNHAWDSCEVGAFSIIAYGTRFAGGPATSGNNKDNFNLLQIDGSLPNNRHTGTLIAADNFPHGGRVVVGGGEAYTTLGFTGYTRQGMVDLSSNGNRAIFATLDRNTDPDTHQLTWNLNPGGPNGADPLGSLDNVIATVTTFSGRPAFHLAGAGGSILGVVLTPSDAVVAVGVDGEPVTVTTTSDNPILIAMLLDDGSAQSTAAISGSGLASTLTWEGRVLRFDGASDRLVIHDVVSNNAPIFTTAPSANPSPVAGSSTTLSAAATDPDGDPITYSWSLLNGPAGVSFSANNSASAATTDLTFQAVGTYQFSLTVADNKGGTVTIASPIEVEVQAVQSTLIITAE